MSRIRVAYVYDAIGTKLTKNSTVNGVVSRQDYLGGIEYSAPSVIERIATEEGYLLNSNGTYSFHYYLTDHLGNNRVVLKKGTSLTIPEIIQRQDYYAFGKTKSLEISGNNRYLYNGKKVQKELGDQLDYGARFEACPECNRRNAEIGRWNVGDPLADIFEDVSPYNYAMNNPILMVDPTGMAADTSGFLNQVIETVVVTARKVDNFRWPTWSYNVPILGAAAESGNNLANGNYVASLGNFSTALAELFTAGYLSQYRIGTKMMSSMADDILVNGLKFRQVAKEAFKKHTLANGRHNDLGVSSEKLVENAFKLIENNKSMLKTGDNTLMGTINGIQKSFKFFVKDGEIMSVNMYPGVSNRVSGGTTIKFGDLLW